MNKQIFKLVFSRHLGMLVPVSEAAKSHQAEASTQTTMPSLVVDGDDPSALFVFKRWQRVLWSLAFVVLSDLGGGVAYALDANALPTGAVHSNNVNISTSGRAMNIQSTTGRSTIRWNTFDIGRDAQVNFTMPSRSSSVLNRVMGNKASEIYGALNANGHVYLVNQNGIYFGNGAQVNVGSLTATTLDDITNDSIETIYNNGILSNTANPVFSFANAVGSIVVDKGAAITSENGGRVMLLAPDVTNSGIIKTPDGQTILAAGKTIFMSTTDDFAGLLVEVSSGGQALNLGEIAVGRGNASLIGLSVNQSGRISASTSVRANGSIFLKAKDGQTTPATYGNVTLGKGSETEITIDVNDPETVINAQTIEKSLVEITGKTVSIDGTIVANGGVVNVNAIDTQGSSNKIFLGENALIDVSGVDATAPMSRNQLEIQLFSDQLRDSPILRGGPLFGEKLYLDARKGTDIISQDVINEAMASIARTVAERMTDGGQVNLNANTVVAKSGATIDVSAGTTTYTSGFIRESRLLNNGRWVLASDAKKGVAYQGINDTYSKSYERWGETRSWQLFSSANGRFQSGYLEGGDAGSVALTGTNLAFQGNILANTTIGTYQRGDVDGVNAPLGGLLDITFQNNGNLSFVNTLSLLDNNFGVNSNLTNEQNANAEIDVSLLDQGVNRLKVSATGQVNVDAEMRFKPNATLTLDANGGLNVNQSIYAPSGSMTLSASNSADVRINEGVTVSTAGRFTNDTPGIAGALTGAIALNGGNITVLDGLRLGKNTTLDASAGAWVPSSKKSSIVTGHGGDITVTLADGNNVQAGSFNSFGFYADNSASLGGKLTLNLQGEGATSVLEDIQLGGIASNSDRVLTLSEAFFNTGGFSNYTLNNINRLDGDIVVGDNSNSSVSIRPQQHTQVLNANARGVVSGSEIRVVSTTLTVADGFRSPASLTLNAGDDLTLTQNASIFTDTPVALTGARGDVTLTAKGQLTVLGDIIAPASNIDISIKPFPTSPDGVSPNQLFDNTLSLFIGGDAKLSATAQYIAPPTSDGNLRSAFITDAGNISLNAGNGVLIVKEGSVLDVSGSQGQVDVAVNRGFERQTLTGDAGVITLNARDGMALDGTLLAKASGEGAGGELHLTLGGEAATGIEGDLNTPLLFTNGSRILTVTQDKIKMASNNVAGGLVDNLIDTSAPTNPLTNAAGKGQISVAQIEEGGFDSVYLKTDNVSNAETDAIQFASGVNLRVPSLLSLDSTLLRGPANLETSTLVLTNTSGVNSSTASIHAGVGTFFAAANFIDIQGVIGVSDVATTQLKSGTDIRGRGRPNALGLAGVGSLTVPSTLVLDAAQVYPSTATDFTFNVLGNNSHIEVSNSENASSRVPLSAVGSLTLNADTITQGGTLRAPLGQISLNADDQLVLKAGSVTSVSAEGSLIPYAVTVLGGTEYAESVGAVTNFVTKLRDKKITLTADSIDLQTGSKVDVSGSGDTFAFEWLQGIGGSTDILGQSGYYAVLPSLGLQYAPYDALMQAGSDAKLGQAIYLSGGNGLSAGKYTLLPARYALVPGAYLIKVNGEAIKQNMQLKQLDGSVLSSGYLTQLDGTSRDQYSSFNIIDGRIFYDNVGTKNYQGPAEYLVTHGNAFFVERAQLKGEAVPRLASDAGQIVLAASDSLNLEGSLVAEKAAGAKGGFVDISASNIRVVSNVDPNLTGVLQLSATQLNTINADSVLLGGARTLSGNSQSITATASDVTFANDANNAVALGELIVASTDNITLNSGAVVGTKANSESIGTANISATGNGSLLAVSSRNDLNFSRTGVSANPTQGDLTLQAGSVLRSDRSLVLDATQSSDKSGNVQVAQGGTVTLGANQFVLGDTGGNGGTRLESSVLTAFGNLSAMTFNSYKNIDVVGPVTFGNTTVNITFNTAGMAQRGNADANIVANTFTLQNTLGATFTDQSTSNGALNINAQNIVLGNTGSASANIDGFSTVNLSAADAMRVSGTGVLNVDTTQTNLNSALLTADTGAVYAVNATGALTTLNNGQTSQATSGLGANLTLASAQTTLGSNTVLSAGQLTAKSTAGDLTVASGANLSVASATVVFDENYTGTTDAGAIHLTSDTGNVVVNAGATVNVSGGETAGDAGKLTVSAKTGEFVVANNTLKGSASTSEDKGSFVLDVNNLSNFSQVNTALESGAFNRARDMRVRNGNVTIAASDTVTANSFTLGVDNGNVEIAGTVNADGAKGGDIAIYASGLVTLKNTSQLLARGTQANTTSSDLQKGSGGNVLLSSDSLASSNAVSAESGALIDTSGYDASDNGNVGVDGADGSVTLRGRRGTTGTANTVNVAFATTGAIKGANEVRVEGSRRYTATTFNNSISGLVTDTNNFYNANVTSGSYAATQDGATIKVLPHIEVRSTSGSTPTALTVSADQNLRSFGTLLAGRGGTLSLRSNGNLVMNGSLSDGFNGVATTSDLVSNTNTFDLILIAGADYSAANLETTVNGTGNFTLASAKLIRTGEGDITVAAGGNMTLASESSVIYTMGSAETTDVSGFLRAASTNSATTYGVTTASYVNNGGDIRLNVQGDITGAVTNQTVNQWLVRKGGGSGNFEDVSWWVRPDRFQQGIAALGGGDVIVNAGGNVRNLSLSSATNAQFDNDLVNSTTRASRVSGGGDVILNAGGNIENGMFYAGRGKVGLSSQGNILQTNNTTSTLIALQDASAEVNALGNASVNAVFNPTLWAPAAFTSGSSLTTADGRNAFFSTYGQESGVSIKSIKGDVAIGLDANRTIPVATSGINGLFNGASFRSAGVLSLHPSTLEATAFGGDIDVSKLTLAPSSLGSMTLLANGSVSSNDTPSSGSAVSTFSDQILGISDADLTNRLSVNVPFASSAAATTLTNELKSVSMGGHAATPVHLNQDSLAVIVAKNGDVIFEGRPSALNSNNVYDIQSAMPLYVNAGGDVTVHASIQHSNPGDVSTIRAGNDFVMENGEQLARLEVSGPGELLVEAGRNIDLGNTSGILSLANTQNPNLAEKGANITLLAGLGAEGADVDSFVQRYINPTGAGPAVLAGNAEKLSEFRKATAERVQTYMNTLTGKSLSQQEAMTQFLALDKTRQAVFAYRQFSAELLEAGKVFIDSASTTRGDDAIATLFSGNNYQGDMLMYQSQVRTSRDSSIDMLAPGGLINAGVASNGSLQHDIGIVTEKGGAIRAFTNDGFEVNQSKVITQFGSDITVWVNNGDIDAGRGSKSAISVPERVVSIDGNGEVTVEVKGVAAGSGIRAQTYDPDGPQGAETAPFLGTVALFAPRGTLDAGEAGIGAGNLLIGAITVLNANNITVAGTSAGVPVADAGSLAGSLAGVADTATASTNSVASNLAQPTPQSFSAKDLPSIVTVKTISISD